MWHLVVELQGHVTVTKNTSRENVVSNSTEEEKIVGVSYLALPHLSGEHYCPALRPIQLWPSAQP